MDVESQLEISNQFAILLFPFPFAFPSLFTFLLPNHDLLHLLFIMLAFRPLVVPTLRRSLRTYSTLAPHTSGPVDGFVGSIGSVPASFFPLFVADLE